MYESGVEADLVASEKWFNRLFHEHPSLQDITVSALKRNFGRCKDCCDIEALVQVGRGARQTRVPSAAPRTAERRTAHRRAPHSTTLTAHHPRRTPHRRAP
jgi:hypothetical protein